MVLNESRPSKSLVYSSRTTYLSGSMLISISRCTDTLRTTNFKTSWTKWQTPMDSCKLHSFGKINLCIPCLVGTDWLWGIAATAVSVVKGRQTGLPSTKPAGVWYNLWTKLCETFWCNHNDHNHVLNHLLPPVKQGVYNLRQRNHNRVIPDIKDSLFRKTFINWMIFWNSY